ncbi:MAG: hypothetical protein KGH61_05175 [Candidatus Micrarchaeota archaeon]|nr:hypothetical protein [Candidatus Micrarchaeota archaeon]MDE1848306.1 hypothetical protein [Candidatus Micrarchaeota archaeon]
MVRRLGPKTYGSDGITDPKAIIRYLPHSERKLIAELSRDSEVLRHLAMVEVERTGEFVKPRYSKALWNSPEQVELRRQSMEVQKALALNPSLNESGQKLLLDAEVCISDCKQAGTEVLGSLIKNPGLTNNTFSRMETTVQLRGNEKEGMSYLNEQIMSLIAARSQSVTALSDIILEMSKETGMARLFVINRASGGYLHSKSLIILPEGFQVEVAKKAAELNPDIEVISDKFVVLQDFERIEALVASNMKFRISEIAKTEPTKSELELFFEMYPDRQASTQLSDKFQNLEMRAENMELEKLFEFALASKKITVDTQTASVKIDGKAPSMFSRQQVVSSAIHEYLDPEGKLLNRNEYGSWGAVVLPNSILYITGLRGMGKTFTVLNAITVFQALSTEQMKISFVSFGSDGKQMLHRAFDAKLEESNLIVLNDLHYFLEAILNGRVERNEGIKLLTEILKTVDGKSKKAIIITDEPIKYYTDLIGNEELTELIHSSHILLNEEVRPEKKQDLGQIMEAYGMEFDDALLMGLIKSNMSIRFALKLGILYRDEINDLNSLTKRLAGYAHTAIETVVLENPRIRTYGDLLKMLKSLEGALKVKRISKNRFFGQEIDALAEAIAERRIPSDSRIFMNWRDAGVINLDGIVARASEKIWKVLKFSPYELVRTREINGKRGLDVEYDELVISGRVIERIVSGKRISISRIGRRYTSDNEYLKAAVKEAGKFYNKEGRSPTYSEAKRIPALGGIVSMLGRGRFKVQNISTYNDFLKYANLKVNWEVSQRGIWTTEDALQSGVDKIKEFIVKNDRDPKNTELRKDLGLRGLMGAIERGKFNREGVKNWKDLIRSAK